MVDVYTIRVTGITTAQMRDAGKKVKAVIANALNLTAHDVRYLGIYPEMRMQFDRATPYTLNSFYQKFAKPSNLVAQVLPKDDPLGGSSVDEYLTPEIYGGDRKLKGLEKRLQRIGVMKPGQYAVPGKGAGLDAYGNMSRGQVNRILTRLGALRSETFNTISPQKLRQLRKQGRLVGRGFGKKRRTLDSEYFVAKSKTSGEPLGVYTLLSRGNVQPVIVFVRKPTYRKHLQWQAVADRVVAQRFPVHFAAELEQAWATVRR